MAYLAFVILALFWFPAYRSWRRHITDYYRLEETLEKRVGSVREWNEGVGGHFALTSSGLIPMLDELYERFGENFTDEERNLMRKSRRAYYVGGFLGLGGILTCAGILVYAM